MSNATWRSILRQRLFRAHCLAMDTEKAGACPATNAAIADIGSSNQRTTSMVDGTINRKLSERPSTLFSQWMEIVWHLRCSLRVEVRVACGKELPADFTRKTQPSFVETPVS